MLERVHKRYKVRASETQEWIIQHVQRLRTRALMIDPVGYKRLVPLLCMPGTKGLTFRYFQ
ncbi:hypothetical protein PsorP6_007895 [Peronosclerospora sorghi]|uniref:Uncharacterized protein n=1 Tax=Peronosclerospora sorghi TaxID=230839 RepID=A0ACC0WAS3_9STRA|nr:hypothetical protein PsorP6_007895 [Peronosclerospora sorghi]